MALPWLMILDTALGFGDVVRRMKGRSTGETAEPLARSVRSNRWLEARLAGVFLAALREAFDRDHERLEMERAQVEAERQRAARALRLEIVRQAGDRETGRLRLVAGVAAACWLAALFFVSGVVDSTTPARVVFGCGWLLLLASLTGSLAAQLRVSRQMDRIARLELGTRTDVVEVGRVSLVDTWGHDDEIEPVTSGAAGAASPWLLVAGLAVVVLGVFLL
jgi:hypothetical protein